MSVRKNTNNNNKQIKDFIKLQLINSLIYLTVFVILCIISVASDIKTENMIYVSMCFIGLSSFITGFVSGKKERKNGMLRGIFGALPLNILFITISLILSDFKADISLLFAVAVCLLMSAAGGIISVNIRQK